MLRSSFSARASVLTGLAAIALTGSAFAQVAGDECTNALAANVGANPFTTLDKTSSANPPSDTQCSTTFLTWGTVNPDVWFTWTVPSVGLLTISTCDAAGFDTSMVLYSGTCASLTQIACNGDSSGDTGCQQYYSKIAGQSVTAGTTYFVRIGGYQGEQGSATLNVAFEASTGACATATGGCGVVHASGGCNQPSCCTTVCGLFPDCCDVTWDQTCVDLAVSQCGIFVYQCTPGGPANNCATAATAVSGDGTVNFTNVGATKDGPDHAAATCSSGNNFFWNDVWFKVAVVANGELSASLCGTVPFDSKLAIYDMGTAPASFDYNTLPTALVGCNDDGTNCYQTDGVTPYASYLAVPVAVGHTYLVRLASYADGDTGSGTITFNVPEPCQLPSSNASEGEVCGSSTNNGCVNSVVSATPISGGQKVAGTFFASAGSRDVDYYAITLAQASTVSFKTYSASTVVSSMFGGDLCTGAFLVATGSGSCPNTLSACMPAGTYYVAIAPSTFDGTPCGSGVFNNYVVECTVAPSACAPFANGCIDAGPDTRSGNSDTAVSFGLVACAGGSYTTDNSYATVFSGITGGQIQCIEFGVSNYQNVGGTLYVGQVQPAKISVYRDTNGGAPVDVGNDLVLVASQDVQLKGGVYLAGAQFDPPICVDGNTQNLVVVLDLYATPSGANFGVRAAGNAGTTAGLVYLKAAGCDIDTYTLSTDIGNFPDAWVVKLNGNFTQCGSNCPADLSGDNVVNGADLGILLGAWGTAAGDLNADGTTNGADLGLMLGAWGNCP